MFSTLLLVLSKKAACSFFALSTETERLSTKPDPRYFVLTSSSAASSCGVPF